MTAIRKINNAKSVKRNSKNAKVLQLTIFRQPAQIETDKLIQGFWNVCKSSIWMQREFSAQETYQLKELIAEHFYNGKNSKQNFKELVERICLVKRYLLRKRGRYISKPQDWLNVHYPKGLAATANWLTEVNKVRKNVPDYNKGINTLALALLKYNETPDSKTFHRYKTLLTAQKQFDLLQIFYNCIINLQYDI